jgi:hypothetical protein
MCRIMLKIKKQLIAYRNNERSFVDSTTSTIIITLEPPKIYTSQY